MKTDRSSRDLRAFFNACRNRRRYTFITIADVHRLLVADDSIDNLDGAVMDCINFRIGDAYDRALEIVSGLPRALQMAYSTWWLDAELTNGGFHQYFYNQGCFALMAAEGCRLLDAHSHLELLLHAIDVYLKEEPTEQLFRPNELTELIEQYALARKFSDLPSLDHAYYALPCLDEIRAKYMQQHPEQFVIPNNLGKDFPEICP